MVHDQDAIKDQVATEDCNYQDLIDQNITGLMTIMNNLYALGKPIF